jgi:gag-polyprotein putative aspartyl protease
MLKFCIALFFFLSSVCCFSQSNKIDTLSFTMAKKLLVFKGQLNGASVDFAFDTGAGIGVLNSANQEVAKCETDTRKKGVKDANNKIVKGQNISIEKLTIGGFEFEKVKSLYVDMEFLQCNKLYLLGQNVISKLNWLFNFENNTVLVSQTPFTVDKKFTSMPVKGSSKRPFTELQIGDKKIKNCLIDFGYSGVLDFPESDFINGLYTANKVTDNTSLGIYSSMGLGGLGKPDTLKSVMLDGVAIGGVGFNNVLVSIPEKTDLKIGVGFFSKYCSAVILNHSTSSYFLKPNNKEVAATKIFDARISIVEGKFIVTGKNLSVNTTASVLEVGDEIKSVEGKAVTDFANPCDYFNWLAFSTMEAIIVEKLNGEKVTVKRGWMK